MEAIVRTRPVLGVDVGKRSHWACLVTADGEIALNAPVANREADLDELLATLPADTLVVVDQVRNIGLLVLKRAEAAGLERAYLPGIAMHGASRLFAGDAKTDERDALVIAKTAVGIPDSLLPVPRSDAATDAARAMASQRDFLVTCATRDKNRLPMQKYHSGGLWANSCCSHPRVGEGVIEAAYRRVPEELGCEADGLFEASAFIYRAEFDNGITEHEFDHVVVGRCIGEVDPNPAEASEVRWVGIEALADELANEPSKFAVWAPIALTLAMANLAKRLIEQLTT